MKQEDFVKKVKQDLEIKEKQRAALNSEIKMLRKIIERGDGRPVK